jgi:hypothetical protein
LVTLAGEDFLLLLAELRQRKQLISELERQMENLS